MKKLTLLSVFAVALTALTFTSCNTGGDDGPYELTKEQQNAYQMNMAGTYSDMVIILDHKNDANTKNQTDSVETTCRFSAYKDSTFTMTNFPIAKLAEHISDPDLKEAVSKVEPKTVKGRYVVYTKSTTTQAYMYAWPMPIELNLNYGTDNKSHKVVFYFSYDQYYLGYCIWSTKKVGFPFYLVKIYVDDAPTNYIKNSVNSANYVSFACRNKVTKNDNN